MTKERIFQIINGALRVDGTAVRAREVLSTVPVKSLIAALALLLGELEKDHDE